MKTYAIVAALFTILSGPAMAQSYCAGFGTGNVIDLPALEQAGSSSAANSAYAQAPAKKMKKIKHRHLTH